MLFTFLGNCFWRINMTNKNRNNYAIFYTKLAFVFLCLCQSYQITPSFAADLSLVTETADKQSFTQDNQTFTITDTGNATAGVESGYSNATLIINASGTNGVSSSRTAVKNVSSIILESGKISSSYPFAITHNLVSEDLNVQIAENSSIIGTYFAIKASTTEIGSDKNLNIDNKGLIQGKYPILLGNANLSLSNSGSIISDDNVSILNYSGVANLIEVDNSGLIHGGIKFFSQQSFLNNSGTIIGDIGGENLSVGSVDEHRSIGITQNSGSIIGNIALGISDASYFILNGGDVIGNLIVAGGEYGDSTPREVLPLALDQNITLNAGSFTGNIVFATDATINLGATNFNGAIISNKERDDRYGTINIFATRSLDSGIALGSDGYDDINIINHSSVTLDGAYIDAKTLNIDAGSQLNFNANAAIDDVNIAGTLNFGSTGKTLTGNVNGNGFSKLNLGTGTNKMTGNLSLIAGDSIILSASNDGGLGKLTVEGAASIASGVKLDVGVGENYVYLKDASSHTIIDGGAGSNIAIIDNNNIDVNESQSNHFGVLRFTTQKSADGSDLIVNISRAAATEITNDAQYQDLYNQINVIGGDSEGSLKNLQSYLDRSTSATQVEKALESITPQDKNGAKLSTLSVTNDSIKTIETRMDFLHAGSLKSPYAKQALHQKESGLSSGDASELGIEIWGQTFGTQAKQKNVNSNGYESESIGLAFGSDYTIDPYSRIGVAVSYANSSITSANNFKKTNIDTYQINLAGSKSYGKYFIGAILGFAWNEYDSSRFISAANVTADSKYSGKNYIAKVRAGATYNKVNDSNFNISPEISSTFVNSRTSSYTEDGANTLNLDVRDNSDEFLEGRVGLRVYHEPIQINFIKEFADHLAPQFNISYGYNFLNKRQITVSNFVGQTTTFNTLSSDVSSGSLQIGFGLDLYSLDSTTLSINYTSDKRTNYISHSGSIKIKQAF